MRYLLLMFLFSTSVWAQKNVIVPQTRAITDKHSELRLTPDGKKALVFEVGYDHKLFESIRIVDMEKNSHQSLRLYASLDVKKVKFSSDSRLIAFFEYTRNKRAMSVMDLETGKLSRIKLIDDVDQFEFSPDSRLLIFTARGPKSASSVLWMTNLETLDTRKLASDTQVELLGFVRENQTSLYEVVAAGSSTKQKYENWEYLKRFSLVDGRETNIPTSLNGGLVFNPSIVEDSPYAIFTSGEDCSELRTITLNVFNPNDHREVLVGPNCDPKRGLVSENIGGGWIFRALPNSGSPSFYIYDAIGNRVYQDVMPSWHYDNPAIRSELKDQPIILLEGILDRTNLSLKPFDKCDAPKTFSLPLPLDIAVCKGGSKTEFRVRFLTGRPDIYLADHEAIFELQQSYSLNKFVALENGHLLVWSY